MADLPPDEPPLAPREVAAILRVDSKTVAHLASAGRIASFRTPTGHRRFRRDEVERFAAAYRPEGDWATVAELATALRVDPQSAQRWTASGKIAGAVKDGTGHWLIPRSTLAAMTGGAAW